ncbi:MAG: capsule assembly Wzi family protein [Geothrix sp.]|nr:capsule assembly Wzi family protein [Geothrix sp.]
MLLSRFLSRLGSCACLLGASASAQLPPGWSHQEALGVNQTGAWYGAGTWSGDKHGAPATFVDSLGLGNALTGQGTHLEAGFKVGHWDLAGQVNAWRDGVGKSRLILQRFHLAYQSQGGWRSALEQEPLVWGYGLNGGYVLGEAARPFPKVRIESPFIDVRILGVPLGQWKAQAFLGQIEGHKIPGENSQDPSFRANAIAINGDPQRPYLSGLRAEARFGENTELYLNYINLFGGSRLGQTLTQGYSIRDWVVSFFGLKDSLAEGHIDPMDPNGLSKLSGTGKVQSASNSDVGIRVRLSPLEQLTGAQDVRLYITRGSKAVNTRFQVFVHRPSYAIGRDLDRDYRNLFVDFTPLEAWHQQLRYVLPSPAAPNDVFGLLFRWEALRLGVEYLDTVNSVYNNSMADYPNHRSFEHGTYLSGFYQEGDPLGNATAGESRTFTAHAQIDWSPQWATRSWLLLGDRPFRDWPSLWELDHPGATPARNRFVEFQQVVEWRPDRVLLARAGASAQHQSAHLNVRGDARTGFRWFIDLGWTWPAK